MPRVAERALVAGDIMKSNPISIEETAPIRDAAELFVTHGFTAAPVINEQGNAIGVVSMTDLLKHAIQGGAKTGVPCVRDVMNRAVFAIKSETPLNEVSAIMLQKQVHRLFVTDAAGTLIGVISTFDMLRHFAPSS